MSREDIPNVLIRLTNVTGFDHTQEANLAFKEATDEIERLLADERQPMECGHPRACLKLTDEEEKLLLGYQAAPCSGAETSHELRQKWQKCSACAERERVREMCAAVAKDFCDESEPGNSVSVKYLEDKYGTLDALQAIRQLDLTKLDEGGEEKV
ncbi:hypothetical protein LCGC14_2198250 [marine sediment metagenome]|uniref:Uncharacterized protein n=1 Tax=marine sediment metagenome TaxID=412755 RepID=A0A0F9DHG3_9ZZZZ